LIAEQEKGFLYHLNSKKPNVYLFLFDKIERHYFTSEI
jgi:hypothetical protein